MLKLTRLNNHVVAINPDHIQWADTTPDTTLFLVGNEKIIVRETLDELNDAVVAFRRLIRQGGGARGTRLPPPSRRTSALLLGPRRSPRASRSLPCHGGEVDRCNRDPSSGS